MTDIPPEKPDERGTIDSVSHAEAGCRRCGTCCRKGGPALHVADVERVRSGIIGLESLLTIRAGERVHDNVRNRVVSLKKEIVKIRGRGDTWTCLFYDDEARSCGIYDHRPLECRALACRDPSELKRIYEQDRITRKDIIGSIQGLWDLVQTHEARCSQQKLAAMIARLKAPLDPALANDICGCIAYDRHLRRLTVKKSGISPALLDFLFGRPLQQTIKTYGFTVIESEGRIRLHFSPWKGDPS